MCYSSSSGTITQTVLASPRHSHSTMMKDHAVNNADAMRVLPQETTEVLPTRFKDAARVTQLHLALMKTMYVKDMHRIV